MAKTKAASDDLLADFNAHKQTFDGQQTQVDRLTQQHGEDQRTLTRLSHICLDT
jgi:hypothetical protein